MMDFSLIQKDKTYRKFQTDLKMCQNGGIFLGLYQNKNFPQLFFTLQKQQFPDWFVFSLELNNDLKVAFPFFFSQAYEQMGSQSNIFHIFHVENLTQNFQSNLIGHLQLNRDKLSSKPYSVIFWVTPEWNKRLYYQALDFYQWVSGTYDFTSLEPQIPSLLETPVSSMQDFPEKMVVDFLEKNLWQYENWQEVRDKKETFLNEIMERANLYDYYVPSYGVDQRGKEWLLDELVGQFLQNDTRSFLALLGDFGTGKSSFLLYYYIHLVRRYVSNPKERIPIFISLKGYQGRLNLEKLVKEEFYQKFQIYLNFEIFQELALAGRFAFIIDGFDEMSNKTDQEATLFNLKELYKLTFESLIFMTQEEMTAPYKTNKVLLSCRTHYFLTEGQEIEMLQENKTILLRYFVTKRKFEILRLNLKEFNERQIEEYIQNNTQNQKATQEILGIIHDTYNLKELSTRPLLLEMIVKTLPALKNKKKINAANLYKEYTDLWIEHDDWRSCLTADGKRWFMWKLALQMYQKGGDFSLHYSLLKKPEKNHIKPGEIVGKDSILYETTTCTFLNRDRGEIINSSINLLWSFL